MKGQNIDKEKAEQARRTFLKKMTVAVAATLPLGVSLHSLSQAKQSHQAVTDKKRWGMLIDANRCVEGCTDCVSACHQENGVHQSGRPTTDAQWIRKIRLRDKQTGKEYGIPLMCQHCEHPPCVDVCPTGASFRRADGIVLVNKHTCIGCRYCMMACPYNARSFIHEDVAEQKSHAPRGKGTVESCTFCIHKLDAGEGTTACVQACQHGALLFGDLNDPDSAIAQALQGYASRRLRADLQLDQSVHYQNI